MTDEDKTKTQPVEDQQKDSTPKVEKKPQEEEPSFDLEELRKEIDSASSSIVSEDVRKLIEKEREEARKTALAQAERDQYLKEKEAEIAQLKKQQAEKEKQTAEQLEQFKKKLDELATSRQVVSQENPFKKPPQDTGFKVPRNSDDLDTIEKESFYALISRRPRND